MTPWLIVVAVVVVVLWAGYYIGAFMLDKRRNQAVETDSERLVQPPGAEGRHSWAEPGVEGPRVQGHGVEDEDGYDAP